MLDRSDPGQGRRAMSSSGGDRYVIGRLTRSYRESEVRIDRKRWEKAAEIAQSDLVGDLRIFWRCTFRR